MSNLPICGDCDGPITISGDLGTCACGSFPFDEDEKPGVVLRTRNIWWPPHMPGKTDIYLREQLFDTANEEVSKLDLFTYLFHEAGIKDGDEFIIKVERTGARPYGDRRLFPYGKEETDEEYNDRISRMTTKEGE
jgi:hypothetical protein